jgi:hypothetical protein
MRTTKIPAPLRVYLSALPLIAGALVAAARQWALATALLAIGACWFIVGAVWFDHRVRRIRQDGSLEAAAIVQIDYPRWMRRVAKNYIRLLAAITGLAIIGALVFVVVALVRA